jgi:hypothetical protein
MTALSPWLPPPVEALVLDCLELDEAQDLGAPEPYLLKRAPLQKPRIGSQQLKHLNYLERHFRLRRPLPDAVFANPAMLRQMPSDLQMLALSRYSERFDSEALFNLLIANVSGREQRVGSACFDVLAARDALTAKQLELIVERAATSHCLKLTCKCLAYSAHRRLDVRVSQRVCTTVFNEHSCDRHKRGARLADTELERLLLHCLERQRAGPGDQTTNEDFNEKMLTVAVQLQVRPVVDLLLTRELPLRGSASRRNPDNNPDLLHEALHMMPDIVPAVLARQEPSGGNMYLVRAFQLDQEAGRQGSMGYVAQVRARLEPYQLQRQDQHLEEWLAEDKN